MSTFLRTATRSAFIRNSLTLLSGTAATQLIAALSAPVLGRLYGPHDYGVLGLFLATSGLLTVIASLQMSTAIMLPRGTNAARGLLQLSVGIAILIAAIIAPVMILGRQQIANALGTPSLGGWLPLVPVAAALSATVAALNAYANRLQLYRVMSASRISGALTGLVVSLWLGFAWRTAHGLFAGFFAGLAVTAGVLVVAALRADPDIFARISVARLGLIFSRFRNFARVATPAALLNNIVQHLPIYIMSTVAGPQAAGHYSMTNRLLGLPSVFVSAAVSEVFQQRASADYASSGSCRPIYLKTLRHLAALGFAPILLIMIFGPDIFALYLGEPWRRAGEFARILSPLFFLRFVVSPLSYVFFIAGRQLENLLAQVGMLVVAAGGLYMGFRATGSPSGMLAFYSAGYSAIYLYYAIRGYTISRTEAAARSEAPVSTGGRP